MTNRTTPDATGSVRALEARLERLEARLSTLLRRVRLLGVTCVALAGSLMVLAPGVALTQAFGWPQGWNVFSSGAPALATDVNDNFQWILEKIGTDDADIRVGGELTAPDGTLNVADHLQVAGDITAADLALTGTAHIGVVRVTCPASGYAPIDVTCTCPAGTQLLSGGASFSSMEHPNKWLASYPSSETAWRVRVAQGTDHTDGSVAILCARIGS